MHTIVDEEIGLLILTMEAKYTIHARPWYGSKTILHRHLKYLLPNISQKINIKCALLCLTCSLPPSLQSSYNITK